MCNLQWCSALFISFFALNGRGVSSLQEQCRSSADAVRNYLAFRVALDEVARNEEGVNVRKLVRLSHENSKHIKSTLKKHVHGFSERHCEDLLLYLIRTFTNSVQIPSAICLVCLMQAASRLKNLGEERQQILLKAAVSCDAFNPLPNSQTSSLPRLSKTSLACNPLRRSVLHRPMSAVRQLEKTGWKICVQGVSARLVSADFSLFILISFYILIYFKNFKYTYFMYAPLNMSFWCLLRRRSWKSATLHFKNLDCFEMSV